MFKKPPVVAPGEDVTCLGRVFGTSLVVKGITWLPLMQAAFGGVMAWVAGRRQPRRSWGQRFAIGARTWPVVLGSEWCHNFMHAAAARLVDKPMDALRITWGMPLVVYYDVNDTVVSPRQHVVRALGGPLSNVVLLAASLPKKKHCSTRWVARFCFSPPAVAAPP